MHYEDRKMYKGNNWKNRSGKKFQLCTQTVWGKSATTTNE